MKKYYDTRFYDSADIFYSLLSLSLSPLSHVTQISLFSDALRTERVSFAKSVSSQFFLSPFELLVVILIPSQWLIQFVLLSTNVKFYEIKQRETKILCRLIAEFLWFFYFSFCFYVSTFMFQTFTKKMYRDLNVENEELFVLFLLFTFSLKYP